MTDAIHHHDDARAALATVRDRRRQVIAEIGVPRWYWWGLALGWILVGLAADLGPLWLQVVATIAVGAAHAAVGQRVMSGRHRSPQLSVRADVAGQHVTAAVFGFLLAVVAFTIAVGLLVNADGARHPSIIASIAAALVVALGGPALMAALRRRAERSPV